MHTHYIYIIIIYIYILITYNIVYIYICIYNMYVSSPQPSTMSRAGQDKRELRQRKNTRIRRAGAAEEFSIFQRPDDSLL